jgi:hypothetical protein
MSDPSAAGACERGGTAGARPHPLLRRAWLLPALLLWAALYAVIQPLADWAAFTLLGLARASHLGEAVAFLLFEFPKVLLLLTLVVFLVTFAQTFVSPGRVRDALSRRRSGLGNLLAALFGIITPFCSCSAVPLFIGFLQAGVPLGVTFSFLVSAPMVNEVALGMLFAMFGWKIALIYAGTGVAIAFFAGLVLGRLRLERQLEPWVQEALKATFLPPAQAAAPTLARRIDDSLRGVREIVGKVWPYLLAGIGVGAFIHGYVPQALMVSLLGRQSWYSVPLAVLVGVPLYSNAAGILPVVEALLGKGAALGSTLAFMMAVVGLSLPETVILRKVLRPRLIGAFVGVVTVGILLVGYLFNLIL